MSPIRLLKRLSRRLKISWREQLSQQDVEALRANIERVGLVIRLRWAFVGALALFSTVALVLYSSEMPAAQLWDNVRVPACALGFVAAYNIYYHVTYRRLGNISILNHAQLLFDVLVATVLIYYSGGVYSWFQSMYLLFILEAAFILPQPRQAWGVAFAAMACYVGVLFLEYFGVAPHVQVPFVENRLYEEFVFVSARALWGVTMMGGAATIGTVFMARIRRRERELAESLRIDEKTGLCARKEYQRVLGAELARAVRGKRVLVTLLVDVDRFAEFNRLFGFDAGDRMLVKVAHTIKGTVEADAEETGSVLGCVCRYGGEEFAIVVTDERFVGASAEAGLRRAERLAELVRAAVADVREQDGSVTVSVGIGCYPIDGTSASEILGAADHWLAEAAERGGNRVMSALSSCAAAVS